MAELARTENYDRLLRSSYARTGNLLGIRRLGTAGVRGAGRDFARLSGYEAIRYVDSYAGYKDGSSRISGSPGFTIELGRGQNPLPPLSI